jgi:hypothetical protein
VSDTVAEAIPRRDATQRSRLLSRKFRHADAQSVDELVPQLHMTIVPKAQVSAAQAKGGVRHRHENVTPL